jgi:hypothetical protein
MIFSIISIFISALFLVQFEILIRKDYKRSWFSTPFWIENRWNKVSWIKKYVFSFMIDGAHFCKFWGVALLCSSFVPYEPILAGAVWFSSWFSTEFQYEAILYIKKALRGSQSDENKKRM